MARDEAYQKAEHHIEAARRRGGVTAIDLSDIQLTEIPEAIASLTQFKISLPFL